MTIKESIKLKIRKDLTATDVAEVIKERELHTSLWKIDNAGYQSDNLWIYRIKDNYITLERV